jgi:hypothetical protein
MPFKYFLKIFSGKIFIYFSIVVFIVAVLFVTGGCEKSDYEKAISGEDSVSDIQTGTIEQINETEETGSDETKNTYTESSVTSSVTEQTAASETTDNDITDDNIWKFTEKSSKVKSLGAFFSKLEVWSAEITINKETGETKGFIFATYTEAGLDGSSTTINTSVLKASLNGTLDFKSLDFKGKITGDITADRNDYFSGPMEAEITGKLSEDNTVFTGNFTTPSYVIFDFALEKS